MAALVSFTLQSQLWLNYLSRHFDGLVALALRLYLAPIFWDAGTHKLNWGADVWWQRFSVQDSVIDWFGSADGLSLPLPTLLAYLAAYAEFFGAILLLFGFATRWISIPLMITMMVAIFTVHWPHGWLAIAQGDGAFATEQTQQAVTRLQEATAFLQEQGYYDYYTEFGNFVVLNNGIEFPVTYLLMLLCLFFMGGGRYISADYWLARRFAPQLIK